MKLIIDIPKDDYELVQKYIYPQRVFYELTHGTPIPDNAANGDVIKIMFDIKEVDMENTYYVHFPEEEDYSHCFFKEWWNAPYQKGGKE